MNMLWLVIFLFPLISCAHHPPLVELTQWDLSNRVKMQEAIIQNLKDENRVMKQRLAELRANPHIEVVDAPPQSGEQVLYSKVIESYRQGNADDFFKSIELFQKGYPQSVHLDNALYLAGLFEMKRGNLPAAQAWFEKQLRLFPFGNKAVSALYAEATIDRRMGRAKQAQKLLMLVQHNYPGSAEAQRAPTELRAMASTVERRWLQ